MRWILALSVMWSCTSPAWGQDYCDDYDEGYEAGWCSDYDTAACPAPPPSGCIGGGGRSAREAWERGYRQGEEDSDFEVAPEEE